MTIPEFEEWFVQQEHWDKDETLPDDYIVHSIYWLYDDAWPVGLEKIRHELTDASRNNGGSIGYTISCKYRGKGYGFVLLKNFWKRPRRSA